MTEQLDRRGPVILRLAPRRVRSTVETQPVNAEVIDPLEAQKAKLEEMQNEHNFVLKDLGITKKAIAVAKKQHAESWRRAFGIVDNDSKFVINRRIVTDHWYKVDHLRITKRQGDENQWTVEVSQRYQYPNNAIHESDGFSIKDARSVGELADELIELRKSGILPNLNNSLDKIR
jgi:hypothetical protein